MAKYLVPVTRTEFATKEIEIEASSLIEAEEIAQVEACNHDFTGYAKDAEYEIGPARENT